MTAPRPFTTLRRYLPGKRVERCGFCGTELAREHEHVLEIGPKTHTGMNACATVCACNACAVLAAHRNAPAFRRVPRRVRLLPDFRMTDAEWDSLLIPIGLAFFVHSTPAGRVRAFYPGPAGLTESLLSLDSWQDLAARNPVLAEMEPDVEALLVNRVAPSCDHYLAPIDRCYELTGLIRTRWRGLSGGDEVWRDIAAFFAMLRGGPDA